MPVTAMRTGDVVVSPQCLAHAYRYGFFSTVQVSQAGHTGSEVKLVDMLLEKADREHQLVHLQPTGLSGIPGGYLCIDRFRCFGLRHTVLQRMLHVYTRHTSQYLIDNREILLCQPHRAGSREDLVTNGNGWQWNIEFPAQFLCQQHVFLHHVHVEPDLFRHVEDERSAILERGEAMTLLSMTSSAVSTGTPPFTARNRP